MSRRFARARLAVLLALVSVGCEGAPETAPIAAVYDFEVLAGGTPPTLEVTSAVPILPSVRVVDASGNPVAGVGVRFAPTQGAATVTGAERVTDANGVATVGSWVLGTRAGEYRLTAVTTQAVGARAEFAATATPGDSAGVTLSPAAVVVATNTTSPAVRLISVDIHGNTLAEIGTPTLLVDDPLVAEAVGASAVRGLMPGRTIAVAELAGARYILPVRVGGATASVTTIGLANPRGLALTPSGTVLVARAFSTPSLVEIDPSLGGTTARPVDVEQPWAISVSPDGTQWFVQSEMSARLHLVDPGTGTSTDSVMTGGNFGVTDFQYSSDGTALVTYSGSRLQRIVRATAAEVSVDLGSVSSIATHPSEPWVFVTHTGTVEKRDVNSLALLQDVAGSEVAATMSPDGSEFYAYAGTTLTAFSAADLTRGRTITLPVSPGITGRLAVSPGGARLFVVAAARLLVYDVVSGALLEDRTLPASVREMRYVPSVAGLVAISTEGNVVMVIR